MVESSGDQALLEGDNSPLPILRFLPLKPGFAIGDRVLTSGRGGLLPAGLAVGRIERRRAAARLRVRPFVDWARLDYVALLAVGADATCRIRPARDAVPLMMRRPISGCSSCLR